MFLYGTEDKYIDVTSILLSQKSSNNIIIIPQCDFERTQLFDVDPLPDVVKHIKIIDDYQNNQIVQIGFSIKLHLDNEDKLDLRLNIHKLTNVIVELDNIHNSVVMSYGSLKDELPEQYMSVQYIDPEDKVLELGGNIGRNSCVIAKLLNNQSNLLVMETHPEYFQQLKHNRDQNNLKFHIENSALSSRKLVQHGWQTWDHNSKDLLSISSTEIQTITYNDLTTKYNINFNTLVCDCEGCLYKILLDTPEMISDFEKVILENDSVFFSDSDIQCKYIKNILEINGFKLVYKKSQVVYGIYYSDFYQVWLK